MIANRKQEWDLYVEQQTAPTVPVKRLAKPDTRFRAKFLTIVLMMTVMSMIVTLQSAFIVKTGYDVVQTKGQIAKMEKENELLHLDIAKMKSPQRIQQIATRDLGMVMPQNVYHATSTDQTASPVVARGVERSKPAQGLTILVASKAEARAGQ
jgi:cell division protein FtsL